MERRATLLIPKRAISQIIKREGASGYFLSLYVYPRHRRKGYCLELMKFAVGYAREFLEMDIRRVAEPAQRNATRLGYSQVGPSERWDDCELWLYNGTGSQFPCSRLRLLNKVTYRGAGRVTDVLYLSDPSDS